MARKRNKPTPTHEKRGELEMNLIRNASGIIIGVAPMGPLKSASIASHRCDRPGSIRVSRGTQKKPNNRKRRPAPLRPMVGFKRDNGKTVWFPPAE